MIKNSLTISVVKSKLAQCVGIPLKVKVNRGRNKASIFDGKIVSLYPAIFKIELDDKSSQTFSYAELLCGTIKLKKNTL